MILLKILLFLILNSFAGLITLIILTLKFPEQLLKEEQLYTDNVPLRPVVFLLWPLALLFYILFIFIEFCNNIYNHYTKEARIQAAIEINEIPLDTLDEYSKTYVEASKELKQNIKNE